VSLVLVWIVLIWRRYLRYKNEAGALAISREKLLNMDPQVFELFVAALFRKRGHRVIVRGGSGDHGVDLELVNSGGRRAIVQCKRYRDTVGEKTVRDLFGTLLHERASRAFMVTTADISDAAVRWARGKPITLINGKQLVDIATAMKEK
jgi:restriction system protein